MWFFTEFLERYTRNFTRSIMRMAAAEFEANQRVASGITLARDGNNMILPERSLNVPPAYVPERRAAASTDAAPAADAHQEALQPAENAHHARSEPKPARRLITLATMPVGVRGELVLRYIEAFGETPAAEAEALIDRLGRDKKIRIAELQLIVAEVLAEAVTRRTKTEHLDALRLRLVPEAASPGTSAGVQARPELRPN
ncbi:hypothetical protein DLJ53_22615 [Acuticoccus sediminis]|uniref:Uncharacterized protein n=1 Tax=Acuticoccus sediminis TaxID=2184697 RepID=A0A8B2NQ60_9HYPH|nr:hypothetical protein [Acuticoccus sediminis]RAH99332.1 hypothetical protein DLJ53_22615 [Acuticoccus sediminis]